MAHPYGFLSLLPPLVAIVLAILTRRAVLSLMVGLFCGALLMAGGNPVVATQTFFEVHLWPTLIDEGKLRVFAFTLLMGALVGVISRGGGMQGLVRWMMPLARTRRGGQLTTWIMGVVIFFDDYANTMLLGSTMRPVCDRLRISREKLSYLVDSTAAPIAGLSLLSTWVAVELEYLQEGLVAIGQPDGFSAVDLFVASIPYRFYVLGAIFFVLLIALSGRDFGPMRQAEERAQRQEPATGGDTTATLDANDLTHGVKPSHGLNAVVPIAITLAVVLGLIITTGRQSLSAASPQHADFPLRDIFGAADSSFALMYGSLAGLVVAVILCRMQRLLSSHEVVDAMQRGALLVLPAVIILWCASSLSRMTSSRSLEGQSSINAEGAETFAYQDQRLYTGDYLARMIAGDASTSRIGGTSSLPWMPTIIFALAAVISFCTGTSFGTMGMLVPLVIPIMQALLTARGESFTPDHPLLLATLGSVLAGAVFGDHCSPISDTTILSSQSSACDHMAHVVTQLPYAIFVGLVAIIFGTLPIGFGVPWVLLLPIQAVVLALGLWRLSR